MKNLGATQYSQNTYNAITLYCCNKYLWQEVFISLVKLKHMKQITISCTDQNNS